MNPYDLAGPARQDLIGIKQYLQVAPRSSQARIISGLHARSHGEAFMAVLDYKFRRSGLFLLDEPEAALSPQRQLSFLILLHQTLRDYADAQFIVSTHSPILLSLPGAQILAFDDSGIHPVAYEYTPAFQITRRFLADPASMLQRLLEDHED